MGICPFIGVSKRMSSAKGMGVAVLLVIVMAVIITYPVRMLLLALDLIYLETIIAALVQITAMVIEKYNRSLYDSLGVYLPLITTNCAVLGTVVKSSWLGYGFIECIVYGIGVSLGFCMAILIMAGIRERIDHEEMVPEAFRGMPLVLITAGLMAIAFSGF